MDKIRRLSWIVLGLVGLSACGSGDIDTDAAVAKIAAERLAAFRKNITGECRVKVLDAARLRADSLLVERARRMRVIAGRPPRPLRPGAPPPKELSAELPLRPLFPYEIRFDTLLRDSLYRDSIRIDSLLELRLDSLQLDSIRRGLLLPPPIEQ